MKYVLTFLLFLALSSCAPPPKQTITKISIGASSGSPQFKNGLYIFGRNENTKQVFMKKVTVDSFEIELNRGEAWRFGAFGWAKGTGQLTGKLNCDITGPITLKDDFQSINLNIGEKSCLKDPFGKVSSTNLATGSPKELQIISCGDLAPRGFSKKNIDSSYLCDDFSGKYNSYKVVMYDFPVAHESLFQYASQNPNASTCVSNASGKNYTSLSNLYIPIFDGIPISIHAFTDSNCTSTKDIFKFPFGLANADLITNQSGTIVSSSTYNKLFLDNTICDASAKLSLTIKTGDGVVAPYVICNAAQFNKINTLGSGLNYYLGSDILLGNNITSVTNAFTGNFNGNGKTITNLSTSLFTDLSNGASIYNLNITDATATATTVDFGILAHTSFQEASSKVSIENITLDNINIIGNFTGGGNPGCSLGALIGKVTTIANGPFSAKNIKLLNSQPAQINSIDQQSINTNCNTSNTYTGGLFGYLGGVSSTSGQTIEVENLSISNTSVKSALDNVGAVAGAANWSKIDNVNILTSTISGPNIVGGVVGSSIGNNEIKFSSFVGNTSIPSQLICSTTGTICTNFGGITGEVLDSTLISHSTADFSLYSQNSKIINNVGGIIGASSSSAGVNNYFNLASTPDFKFDGGNIGGLIGTFSAEAISAPASSAILSSSIVKKGSIRTNSINDSVNTSRGGVVGNIQAASTATGPYVRFVIALPDIEGSLDVAGIAGSHSGSGNITETYYNGNLSSQTAGSVNIGGLIGTLSGTGVITESLAEGTISLAQTATFAGYASLTIATGTAQTATSGGPMNIIDAVNSSLTCTASDTSSCKPTYSLPTIIDPPSGRLLFEKKWGDRGYLAGNLFEPFLINNETDWNNIQDDAFLLTKAHALTADLDFQGPGFNAIGVKQSDGTCSTEAFTGMLLANSDPMSNKSFTMRNILIDTNSYDPSSCDIATGIGIVNRAGNLTQQKLAFIGRPLRPLIIDYITINNNSLNTNIGSVTGRAEFAFISAHVTNGIINNTNASSGPTGGLIGQAVGALIFSSFFEGSITASGAADVGGLLGANSASALLTNISIIASNVKFDNISGASNVGGFVGSLYFSTSDNVSISQSYVKAKTSSSKILSSAGNEAGFIAGIAAGVTGEVNNNYVILNNSNLSLGNSSQNFHAGNPTVLTLSSNYYIGDNTNSKAGVTPFIDMNALQANTIAVSDLVGTSLYTDANNQIKNFWEP